MITSPPVDDQDGEVPVLPMLPASPTGQDRWAPVLHRLAGSAFRARFRLSGKDLSYWRTQGADKIADHAQDFISRRLAPANPVNDGKQTPMRGHPVFVAQHATATCCRSCLAKWHGMRPGVALTEAQQHDVVDVILAWLSAHTAAREDEAISQPTSRTTRNKKEGGAGETAAGQSKKRSKARAVKQEAGQADEEADKANQNRQGSLF